MAVTNNDMDGSGGVYTMAQQSLGSATQRGDVDPDVYLWGPFRGNGPSSGQCEEFKVNTAGQTAIHSFPPAAESGCHEAGHESIPRHRVRVYKEQ